MPAEVRVPILGESVVEATVGAWLKREGERVEAGEPLVQLETEKVNVDVAADAPGVLGALQHREGDTVHPGDVLAMVDTAASAPAAQTPPAPEAEPQPQTAAAAEAAEAAAASEADRPHASPVARRMAEEHGLDLSRVEGTGTGGRVTREDVERHIQAGSPRDGTPAPSAPPAPAAAPTGQRPDQRGETR